MESLKEIKFKLFRDLNVFESDLTRLTKRKHKRIMRLVRKLARKVNKYYD